MKIFLSVGATYNEKQESFVTAFEVFLGQNGCERLTVGRGNYFASQPIVSARDLMSQADAVVVIAFTRLVVSKAIDKPGSKSEEEITNRNYPTVWNQLEAAMAFGLNIPLLVILEKGIYQEAMLKDRHEYRTLVTDLDKNFFSTEEFRGIFTDWKRLVTNRSQKHSLDIQSLTIGRLIKELQPGEFWKVIMSAFTVLSAVFCAAYWIGKTLG